MKKTCENIFIVDLDLNNALDMLPSQSGHLDLHDYCSKGMEQESKLKSNETESDVNSMKHSDETADIEGLEATKGKSDEDLPSEAGDENFKKYMISHPKKKSKAECADCGYTCTGKDMLRRHIYTSKLDIDTHTLHSLCVQE